MPRLTPVPFYFLRHGETDWNRLGILQGGTDTELNDCGLRQAEEIAAGGEDSAAICIGFAAARSRRARRTAEIVNRGNGPADRCASTISRNAVSGFLKVSPSDGAWRELWREGEAIAGGETLDDYMDRAHCRG